MRTTGSLAFVAILLLTGCGRDAVPAGEAAAPSRDVTIEAIAYEPPELKVSVGDRVTWTNQDEGVKHTVTSGKPGDQGVPGLDNGKPDKPDGIFDGALGDAGDAFGFTFEEAGTFEYFCRVHPVMTARVVVAN
jgi:plastocyanin